MTEILLIDSWKFQLCSSNEPKMEIQLINSI